MNEHLKAMAIWGGLCVLLCGVLYLSSNCIAETFLSHHRLYLECEKDIPQVPGMIIFYESYFLLVLLSFIRAKSPKSLRALSITMMVSAVIACTIFLLFPGELGFSRTMNIEGFESIFEALHRMDKPHNLYPSLHITFSSISAFTLIKALPSPFITLGNDDFTVGHSDPSTSPVRYRNWVCFGMDHLEIYLSQARISKISTSNRFKRYALFLNDFERLGLRIKEVHAF